jgi:hypothetical protein
VVEGDYQRVRGGRGGYARWEIVLVTRQLP